MAGPHSRPLSAKEAAQFASALARRVGTMVRKNLGSKIVQTKPGNHPITKIDLDAEKIILKAITAHFPGHWILSEEKGLAGRRSEFLWVVDPLDGTSNFAAGIPLFAVSIALLRQGKPFAAGIYLGSEDSIYSAAAGGGSFRNGKRFRRGRAAAGPISLVGFQIEKRVPRPVSSESARVGRRRWKGRSLGSGITHMVYAADGRFRLSLDRGYVWDFAGGALLVEEAGGLCRTEKGEPLFPLSGSPHSWISREHTYLSGSRSAVMAMLRPIR